MPGSGRSGLRQQGKAGERCSQHVVADSRLEFGRSDAGLGREVDRGSAAKAIVAARNSVIMTMPVMLVRRRPGVVDVLFGAGL